jgi:hypothetical protein
MLGIGKPALLSFTGGLSETVLISESGVLENRRFQGFFDPIALVVITISGDGKCQVPVDLESTEGGPGRARSQHQTPSPNNLFLAIHGLLTMLISVISLLFAGSACLAAASPEWPIPIPDSLLPRRAGQHAFGLKVSKPENVRLIQTREGKYQWTGDIERLLREGVKLMDVSPLAANA